MERIALGNREYNVQEAKTDEEKERGLSGIESLPSDQGMIFYMSYPQEASFWMKDTKIPLDIIFINDEQNVIKVAQGQPMSLEKITAPDTMYVVEVNQGSGVKEGDSLDFLSIEEPEMKVLAPDGSTQMYLWGGERIISRKETKVLLDKAAKASKSGNDKDYAALGKYAFNIIKKQDNRDPEYVKAAQ